MEEGVGGEEQLQYGDEVQSMSHEGSESRAEPLLLIFLTTTLLSYVLPQNLRTSGVTGVRRDLD